MSDDIFISYTHYDNIPPGEGQKGWVDLFHKSLIALIEQYFEKSAKVWRDPKLHGHDIIEESLRRRLSASGLLVTIVSPKYLRSRWCLRELRWFIKFMNQRGGVSVGSKSRIFKVEKTKSEQERLPRAIKNVVTGYNFYHYDETEDYIEHFKQGAGVPYDTRYWDTLDKLAQDIVKMLKILEGHRERHTVESAGKVVYLAEPTPDLQSEYKRIKDELMKHDYYVLPDEPLPVERPHLHRLLSDYFNRSSLSIHLIGQQYLSLPQSEKLNSVIRLQKDLAAARLARANFSRLIWVPDDLAITNEQESELVSYGEQRWMQGTEFLQCSLDELKAVTLEKLEMNDRRPMLIRRKSLSATKGLVNEIPSHKTIYLIYDKQDEAEIEAVHDCLYERGYEVSTPVFDAEDYRTVARHKSKLAHCDGILIYYGKGNQEWLESNLDYLEIVRGTTFNEEAESNALKPLLARFIYVAAPETYHKHVFKTRRVKVIKGGEFDCTHLNEFFAQMQRAEKEGKTHAE